MCYTKYFTLWNCNENSFLSFQENKSHQKEIHHFPVYIEINFWYFWDYNGALLWAWVMLDIFSLSASLDVFFKPFKVFSVICWIQFLIWNSSKSETSDFTLRLSIEQTVAWNWSSLVKIIKWMDNHARLPLKLLERKKSVIEKSSSTTEPNVTACPTSNWCAWINGNLSQFIDRKYSWRLQGGQCLCFIGTVNN